MHLFKDKSESLFNETALNVFKYQAANNPTYKKFISLLGVEVSQIKHYPDIPLLPILYYKSNAIKTNDWKEEQVFLSSGTTGSARSQHYIRDLKWYDTISKKIFETQVASLENKIILGLLPNYLENESSSLIHMTDSFIKVSNAVPKHYYLYNHEKLHQDLSKYLLKRDHEVYLIGVTYALIEFAKKYKVESSKLKIIYTGGMKTHEDKYDYASLSELFSMAFPESTIISEYGMTEMLSQCYSNRGQDFVCPPTVRISPRELQDPLTVQSFNKRAVLGMIDLANIDSCSFIMTQDMVKLKDERHFELLGRMTNSEIRGCHQLYQP